MEVKGAPFPHSNVANLHLVHLDRFAPPLGNLSVVPVWFSHPKDFQSTIYLNVMICIMVDKCGQAWILRFLVFV